MKLRPNAEELALTAQETGRLVRDVQERSGAARMGTPPALTRWVQPAEHWKGVW